MNKPFAILLVWHAWGICWAAWLQPDWRLALALALVVSWTALRWSAGRGFLLGPLLFVSGFAHFSVRQDTVSPHDLRQIVGDQIIMTTIRGVALSGGRLRDHDSVAGATPQAAFRVQVQALRRNNHWQPAHGLVWVRLSGVNSINYSSGAPFLAAGLLRRPASPNSPGCFHWARYLALRQIYYEFVPFPPDANPFSEPDDLTGPRSSPSWTHVFQAWAKRTLSDGLEPGSDPLRLLLALALGDKANLPVSQKETFMHAGALHFFAISGLHLTLIAGMLLQLLRWARVRRFWAGFLVIPALWFYVAATGWQASAVRAVIMVNVVLIGWALRRPSDPFNSLCAAAFLILLGQPEQLFHAGFQLSFGVVMSLVVWLPRVHARLRQWLAPDPFLPRAGPALEHRWGSRVLMWMASALSVTTAAWLGSMPLQAALFHLCTPIGLVANLALGPCCAGVLISVMGSLISAPCCGLLSVFFNQAAWWFMRAMMGIADYCAALPGAWQYVAAPAPGWLLLYYGVLFGMGAGWISGTKRSGKIIMILTAALLLPNLTGFFNQYRTTLTVLPLQGGQASFIDAPGWKQDWLLDTGDETNVKRHTLPLLKAAGVDRLPALVLSHGDIRHYGGASWVTRTFKTDRLYVSGTSYRSYQYRKMVSQLEREGLELVRLDRGDQTEFGTVIYPSENSSFSVADDKCLVLRAELHGVRFLFCSDLSRRGQRFLIESGVELRADVLICSVNAEPEPVHEAFLAEVQPRLTLISSSSLPPQERASGHFRERMARQKFITLFTDLEGAICVEVQSRQLAIKTFRGRTFGVDISNHETPRE